MIDNTFKLSKQIRQEIGRELWRARQEKHLYIYQVTKRTKIPIDLIDVMELGKATDINALQKLLKFYGKKMRIVFE
ncbi:MAG: hypothetical protein IJ532_05185 [Alphaproteobacteria bacterium]|nr:hypothetical protein [Alphaproteobacteria bacterium]